MRVREKRRGGPEKGEHLELNFVCLSIQTVTHTSAPGNSQPLTFDLQV